MHEPFRQAVELCLPQAKASPPLRACPEGSEGAQARRVVADKFHVIRHVNGAVDKVRSKLQGGNRKGKRADLFKDRYTLLKGAERLTDGEKARLTQLFRSYPQVEKAWTLKER